MATSIPHPPGAGRRASTRVRKQTEPYAGSSPSASSSKRKRSNEGDGGDEDLPDDDEPESEDIDEEDGEPDEEEIRETSKKARKPKGTATRKPAQKKPKVNGAALPIRSGNTGAKKRVVGSAKAFDTTDAETAGGLYAEVFATGKKLDEVAAEWLGRFDADESSALAEVVNFILKCAGCEGTTTEHDIEDPDGVTNKLDDLREEYQATSPTEYPLIAKGRVAASFKQTISSFMKVLILTVAARDLLYTKPVLLESIQIWLSAMSSAPNRSFRHTSTVLSLCVVTALCEIARANAQKAADWKHQAEIDHKKPRVNKARVKDLEEKATQAQRIQTFDEELLKDWFDVFFVHRYRDVDPLIRRECVSALGEWIMTMRDVFFDSQHLRYLGWVLSDPAPATRCEVIKQLSKFYKNQDMRSGLKTFTEKFRPRIVEIATTDADIHARTTGIELLNLLREAGMLEPDDIDAVGRLIYDSDIKVRKSAASFFTENVNDLYTSKVDELGGLESLEEGLPEVGDDNHEAPRLEWLRYKSLAEMLQSYDNEEVLPSHIERVPVDGSLALRIANAETRFTLAAEVLYDRWDDVKDWQTLSGYLLFDHSAGRVNGVSDDALSQLKHECVLTEKEEPILLEVLHASVSRTLTDQAEKLTAAKSKLTKKQREQLQEEHEESTRLLATLIPRLLKRFGDIPSTAAAVLKIESVFNIPALQDFRQDSAAYAAFMDDVRKQFMSHSTDEVLGPASNSILHAKFNGDGDDLTEDKINALWDDVVSSLAETINTATITVRGASSSEELITLSNALLRVIRLATVSDCAPPLEDSAAAITDETNGINYDGMIDYIIALVQRAFPASGPPLDGEEAVLEDEVATRASEAALFYMRWKLKYIISTVTTSTATDIPLEALEAIAARRDAYADHLATVLQCRKAGEAIRISCAGALLELHSNSVVLNHVKRKPGINDDYRVLAMALTDGAQKLIMQTFAAAEKQFARLSSRKLESDAADDEDADVDADPIDDDPMSDVEDEDDDQDSSQSQAVLQRREAKALSVLLAEQRLCNLVGEIIHALAAGVMDQDVTRKRLDRNKARLGPNYKECVAFLDVDEKKAKGKARKAATNSVSKAKANPKSNAIVAEDEIDDEIEDAEDEEALRRQELGVDDEPEAELEEDVASGANGDVESVLGD